MQEQLVNQLAQLLQERAGLDAEKAQQVTQVVIEFAQQHAGELIQMAAGEQGQGMLGNLGGLGGLFNRG